MNATHWQLPDAPLRASAVTSKLIGLITVLALAGAARTCLPLGERYPLKASARFAVIQIVALTLAMVPAVTPPLSTLLAAIAFAALTCSFLIDTLWLRRHAQ
jgi:hypothetical protein